MEIEEINKNQERINEKEYEKDESKTTNEETPKKLNQKKELKKDKKKKKSKSKHNSDSDSSSDSSSSDSSSSDSESSSESDSSSDSLSSSKSKHKDSKKDKNKSKKKSHHDNKNQKIKKDDKKNKNKNVKKPEQEEFNSKIKKPKELLVICENEINNQISKEEEISILNLLNDSLNSNQAQSLQNEKNASVNSPYIPQVNIPFQLGDEIDDEKFYLYVKECIKNIKSEWSLYSKLYLKKIIKSFRKTENIFTFRRYLKEPFKEILTDFILYILTKDNKKPEDEGDITLNNNIEIPKKETTTLLGKKTERQNFDEKENENSKEKNEQGNNENINKENKENMNENSDKNNIKENSDKLEKETNKIAEEENKDKDKDKSNDIEDEIILNREYTSIIDLFNYSAQRKCVELKDNAPITKRILYEYIPKKTMISCLSAVLFDLGGKSLAEASVSAELSLFLQRF